MMHLACVSLCWKCERKKVCVVGFVVDEVEPLFRLRGVRDRNTSPLLIHFLLSTHTHTYLSGFLLVPGCFKSKINGARRSSPSSHKQFLARKGKSKQCVVSWFYNFSLPQKMRNSSKISQKYEKTNLIVGLTLPLRRWSNRFNCQSINHNLIRRKI